MGIFQWTTPSFAQLPASSAQALLIKYFRKILFPSRAAAHATFSICAQNVHSALDHEVPGRDPHQAVWSEHVRSAACPSASGAARPALIAEPRLSHAVFSSRKLRCARVRSKATGCFQHSPPDAVPGMPAVGHQARETTPCFISQQGQTPPVSSCSLSGGELHGILLHPHYPKAMEQELEQKKSMGSNMSYQLCPGNIIIQSTAVGGWFHRAMNYTQLFTEPKDATTTHHTSLRSHLSAAPAFIPVKTQGKLHPVFCYSYLAMHDVHSTHWTPDQHYP